MHIVFLNPQGNFDRHDTYWRNHFDFGDQNVYVKEVAIEIAKAGHSVDIITRYINDDQYSSIKGEFDSYDFITNLRIVRIRCGGESFLDKDSLWDYLDEWVDNIIEFYKEDEKVIDFASGHNADGGLACALLKDKQGIPYSYTGHSFGAMLLNQLNGSKNNFNDIDQLYHLTKRILAERIAIGNSNMIMVSTFDDEKNIYNHPLYKVYAKHSRLVYTKAGVNINRFTPYNGNNISPNEKEYFQEVLKRDLDDSRINLKILLNVNHLSSNNNHLSLLQAYAKDDSLQDKANIVFTLRNIENPFEEITNNNKEETRYTKQILQFIAKNNLSGKVAFITVKSRLQLSELYRFIAVNKGVYVSTTLYESLGLSQIEALSTGLPVVSTKSGAPQSILQHNDQEFGVLIDADDIDDIAKGIHEALDNHEFYSNVGRMRVINNYTWKETAKEYINGIQNLKANFDIMPIPDYFYSHDTNDLPSDLIEERYLSTISSD